MKVVSERQELLFAAARRSLGPYIRLHWPLWKRGRHIDRLIKKLHQVERGEVDRLIVLMPPRHSKSVTVSQYFPAWCMGRHPDWQIISSTYSQDLSNGFGRKVRDYIRDPRHRRTFPESRISTDASAKDHFTTTQDGVYVAVGRGGTVTGRGASLFLVDDPVKDKVEATSETLRRALHEWFQTVAYTRLMPDGRIVICQCIAEGERVLLADGRNVPIETIKAGDLLWGYDDKHGIRSVAVLKAGPSGEDETFAVATDRSRIVANARHPFLVQEKTRPGKVRQSFTWKRLGELKVGDILVTLKGLPEDHVTVNNLPGHDDRPVTEDFMWMFGYLFGDGFVTRHVRKKTGSVTWAVSCAKKVSEEKNARLQDSFEREFGRRPYEPAGVRVYRLDSAAAGKMLWDLGLHAGAKTKRLPEWVFGTSAAMKRAFLRGLLDADGSRVKGQRMIRLGLNNFELLDAARMLAFQCGVRVSNVSAYHGTAQPPNSPKPVEFTCYSSVFAFTEDEEEGRSHIVEKLPHHRMIRLDRIRSIEPAGRRQVYDLTMEGENFVAENFIVHNTLWNEDDLAGWLMREHMDDGFEVMAFPAIAEEDEYADGELWRKKGEALWPEFWPLRELERRRAMLTTEDWQCLYQQKCISDQGNVFKVRWFDDCVTTGINQSNPFSGRGMTKYIVVDPASSKTKGSDFTSMWVLGLGADENVYVLDMLRDRLETPGQRADALFTLHKRHKPIQCVLYEEYGLKGDVATIRERQLKPPNYWFAIRSVGGTLAKTERIKQLEPFFRAARIRLPETWWSTTEGKEVDLIREFRSEYKAFPKGAHDDMLDALARIRTEGVTLDFPQTPEEQEMERMLDQESSFYGDDGTSWLSQ